MTIIVGSARIDENGKISGGQAGDQTGREVATEKYYLHKKGWWLIRPKDVSVAERIADAMLSACNNDCIGYDQSGRYGVVNLAKGGTKLRDISVKTEADCSSLVRACCIEAGFDPGDFNTSSEPTVLAKTGRFEEKVSVTASTVLYNGDILVTKSKGHTVVVVSGNPRTAESKQPEKQTASTGVDKAMFKAAALAGTYVTTAKLNLRSGAGINKQILATMECGEDVKCYGFYNKVADGTKWLYVVYKDKHGKSYTGYASSKFLKKA